jgi:hypothetical protein
MSPMSLERRLVSGVVHQNIDAAQFIDGFLDEGSAVIGQGYEGQLYRIYRTYLGDLHHYGAERRPVDSGSQIQRVPSTGCRCTSPTIWSGVSPGVATTGPANSKQSPPMRGTSTSSRRSLMRGRLGDRQIEESQGRWKDFTLSRHD